LIVGNLVVGNLNVGNVNGSHNRADKIYGISQNPNTRDYILVLQELYCEKCKIHRL